jgi:hypothetical protein
MRTIVKLEDSDIEFAKKKLEIVKYNVSKFDLRTKTISGTWEDRHFQGALAESLTARHLNLISTSGKFEDRKSGNVGQYEVRSSIKSSFMPNLLLNERDIPNRKYILVVKLSELNYEIMGWEWGYNIMVDKNIFYRPHFVEKLWKVSYRYLKSIDDI